MISFDELCAALDRRRGVTSAPAPGLDAPSLRFGDGIQSHAHAGGEFDSATMVGAASDHDDVQAAGGERPDSTGEIDLDELAVDEVS